MKIMKKNWFTILLMLVLGVFIILYIRKSTSEPQISRKVFSETDLSSAVQITCTYPQLLSSYYENGEISQSLNKPETNPLIFTFSKLTDPEIGQLSYIDATRTITNVPIIKIIDNEEKFVFLDGGGENYLSIHTIYKKQGISTYTKNVKILDYPSLSMGMGTCTGY